MEHDDAVSNIFRRSIEIPLEQIIACRSNANIARYFSPSLKVKKNTLFHSSYYRTSPAANSANIITVYDFTYEYFRSGLPRLVHHNQKKQAIAKADGVICISDSTKRDLLKFFPQTLLSKIKTIYLSASAEYKKNSVLDKLPTEFSEIVYKDIILFVGDRSHYKNFDVALKAVQITNEATLVVVGGKPFSESEMRNIRHKLNGRFYHFAKLDNEKLNHLYNMAAALLYPSSYEGFGIPILEAMQAGCPVITSNRSSIPEVCGDAGLMVEEISAERFAEKISLLKNNQFRETVIAKGFHQASKFSWNKTFTDTMDFYTEVYERKFDNRL